jgi:CBS domain-containing protein
VNVVPLHAPRLVGDLMASEPIVVHADAGLAEAAALMDRHGISGLPVIDGAGLLVGVVSESDLLRARATESLWANRDHLRIRNLMTSPALTITRDEPLTQAARRMERHHVSRLVVVADDEPSRPIGILAAADLIRAMAAEAEPGDEQDDAPVAAPGPLEPAPVDGDAEGD